MVYCIFEYFESIFVPLTNLVKLDKAFLHLQGVITAWFLTNTFL